MRNQLLALGIMLFFTSVIFAQANKASNPSLSINTTKYVIGIGNDDAKMYNEVLTDLQTNETIKIYAYCEKDRIIALIVNNNDFKSYDYVRDFLLREYPDILLFRKNETILNLDCNDQISKQ